MNISQGSVATREVWWDISCHFIRTLLLSLSVKDNWTAFSKVIG